jgi:DNA-binding NarL/FixJ family response regulator
MHLLIVDDHPMILHGLMAVFSAHGHQVLGADTLHKARVLLHETAFDVLLLDFNLQQENGLDLLKNDPPPLPPHVVLLSGMTEQEDVILGFEMGVQAFISKTTEPADLLQALESLATLPQGTEGLVWESPEMGFVRYKEAFHRDSLLSPKEREVFMLLRQGMLDKRIADLLNISIHTVRVHIRAIKRKRKLCRRGERLS